MKIIGVILHQWPHHYNPFWWTLINLEENSAEFSPPDHFHPLFHGELVVMITMFIRGDVGQSLRLVSALASPLFQWHLHRRLPRPFHHHHQQHHHHSDRLHPCYGSVFWFSIDFSAIFLRLHCLFRQCAQILSPLSWFLGAILEISVNCVQQGPPPVKPKRKGFQKWNWIPVWRIFTKEVSLQNLSHWVIFCLLVVVFRNVKNNGCFVTSWSLAVHPKYILGSLKQCVAIKQVGCKIFIPDHQSLSATCKLLFKSPSFLHLSLPYVLTPWEVRSK